ncbi:DUF5412 domain-containing protein [Aquibacillus sp. 3ASR75-11]|uniref:DUF5412 domain-containing protein n=1 Tax=Terrihalobacillus insolitus TaxID=2950438 RepID=A0A9X4AMU2_9BACI|nr:DUF5412 family protein [Terrihalobacillus insolitus]MDC3413250.1 DUF5412 domain-containing protein [Terrihalobacillus insolitus]MDC3425696.1 DUF5412 domain-containing protein [Terrihalobacillus insolitus]
MERKYNLWSFFLCLLSLLVSLHSIYAFNNQTWSVSPPVSILWLLTVIAFVMGIVGFKDKRSRGARWRSWLTVLVTFSLSAVLILGIAVNTFTREPIKTIKSPDSKITIDFYTVNGGAATSIGVLGIVNGPLWFKKNIYDDNNMHKADVEWTNNHTIIINNHALDLNKGETFSD